MNHYEDLALGELDDVLDMSKLRPSRLKRDSFLPPPTKQEIKDSLIEFFNSGRKVTKLSPPPEPELSDDFVFRQDESRFLSRHNLSNHQEIFDRL